MGFGKININNEAIFTGLSNKYTNIEIKIINHIDEVQKNTKVKVLIGMYLFTDNLRTHMTFENV